MYNPGQDFRNFAIKHQGIPSSNLDRYNNFAIENMTRSVIEERPMNFREVDVFSRLIADRILWLGMGVDDNIANILVAQMLFLESADPKKDITLYVNSPGGSVYAGLGIYSTMQYIRPDVATVCTSLAASMGCVILAGGAKGKRAALPYARIMQHQPSGSSSGVSRDIEISTRQIVTLRNELYQILSDHSGQPFETIEKDCERDHWMIAQEAKDYGFIDQVLQKRNS